MDINQFREQYPQYNGTEDAVLSDALYEKHYKGKIDKADFETKFLGAPIKSDSLIGAEYGDWLPTKAVKSLARTTVNAIKGDAEFDDLGNINSAKMGDSFGVAKASMLGDDSDYAKAVIEQYPGHSIGEDKNGNTLILDPEGKPKAYVNQPGLDAEDLFRLFPKVAAFLPAAKGAQLAGKAGGFASRVLAGGAGAAATDAAMQKVAGRDEIDGGQVAVTGLLGAGAEAAAPALGRLAKKYFGDKDYIMAGRRVAQERGLRNQTREQLKNLGEVEIRAGDAMTDTAKVAEGEFGLRIPRSRAMKGGTPALDEAKYRQASLEESVQDSLTNSGVVLRDQRRGNVSQIEKNLSKLSELVGGRGENAVDAADNIRSSVSQARAAAKSEVNSAYNLVRSKEAWVDDEIVLGIPDRIRAALENSDVIVDDQLTRGTTAALRYVDNFADSSMKQIDNQRRKFNALLESTKNDPPDHRAIKIIKDEFDSIIADAAERKMISGDLSVVEDLKNARALRADFGKRFERSDYIAKIVDKDLEPEQVANLFVGANGMSNASAAKGARQYAEIVGKQSDEWKELKRLAFMRFTQDRNGEFALGAQALSSNIKRAMNVKNRSLFTELFEPEELATIKRFGEAVEATLPLNEGNLRRSSGTAERAFRFIAGAKMTPLLGEMLGAVANNFGERVANRAIVSAKPISLTAPVAATYSSQ